jgi:hypothetical protein
MRLPRLTTVSRYAAGILAEIGYVAALAAAAVVISIVALLIWR